MTLEKITRRIAALEEEVEQRFPKPQPPSQKKIAMVHEFLRRLLPTMAPEHVSLLEAYMKDTKRAPNLQGLVRIFILIARCFLRDRAGLAAGALR